MVFLLFVSRISQRPPCAEAGADGSAAARLDCREAISTAGGRSRLARTLVELATGLETSPSLWSLDPETAVLTLPGHSCADVESLVGPGLRAEELNP